MFHPAPFLRLLAIALAILTASPLEAALKIIRQPYLQSGGAERMTLKWRTDCPATSEVRFGKDPDDLDLKVKLLDLVEDHEIHLEGLVPDTRYYYKVKNVCPDGTGASGGGTSDHYFRTAPATGVSKPTRIWVIGDSGTRSERGSLDSRTVYEAFEAHTGDGKTDVWLMLGDNAYPDGTDE
ncbi:MAG: fibronectin type III domain-containing protein, partial [Verrucomicrobiota bacterium]